MCKGENWWSSWRCHQSSFLPSRSFWKTPWVIPCFSFLNSFFLRSFCVKHFPGYYFIRHVADLCQDRVPKVVICIKGELKSTSSGVVYSSPFDNFEVFESTFIMFKDLPNWNFIVFYNSYPEIENSFLFIFFIIFLLLIFFFYIFYSWALALLLPGNFLFLGPWSSMILSFLLLLWCCQYWPK